MRVPADRQWYCNLNCISKDHRGFPTLTIELWLQVITSNTFRIDINSILNSHTLKVSRCKISFFRTEVENLVKLGLLVISANCIAMIPVMLLCCIRRGNWRLRNSPADCTKSSNLHHNLTLCLSSRWENLSRLVIVSNVFFSQYQISIVTLFVLCREAFQPWGNSHQTLQRSSSRVKPLRQLQALSPLLHWPRPRWPQLFWAALLLGSPPQSAGLSYSQASANQDWPPQWYTE